MLAFPPVKVGSRILFLTLPKLASGRKLVCGQSVLWVASCLNLEVSLAAVSRPSDHEKRLSLGDKPTSPGCALVIMRDGHIIYERGYGMADLDHNVKITPTTVFHVASMSKQFTAASVLMLAQEGKLSLDDEAIKYVPELPNFGVPITLRHPTIGSLSTFAYGSRELRTGGGSC